MENILEKINKAGLEFIASLDLSQTYTKVVEEATKLVGAKLAVLYLKEENKWLRAASFPSAFSKVAEPGKNGFISRAYNERRAFLVPADKLNKVHSGLGGFDYELAIFVPLSDHHKSIGTLILFIPKKEAFSEKELKILQVFGSYASLAIRKAHLFEEIKEALETRDLFISMAAHELRTPITTISGYIQLLHSRLSGIDSTESRWVEELSWELTRLTRLVNELLEVSRINTGKLRYVWREYSLKTMLEKAIQDFHFSYPHHKLIFQNQLGTGRDVVVGDFDKLLQVVVNLLDNAGKFSSPGTEVTVSLKTKLSYVVLTIKDQGKGIAKKDLPRVFDGFYQGKEVVREGMGLGLFLTKKIIDEHRGSVSIRSKLNHGTIVEVKLPQAKYEGITP